MKKTDSQKEDIKKLLVSCKLLGQDEKLHLYLEETLYKDKKLIAFAGILRYHFIFPCFSVVVAPAYRNKGIGKWISAKVANRWRLPIILTVLKNNQDAIRIYEQLGFKKICTWRKIRGVPQWLMIRFWRKKQND